jgi:adenylate cyclase
MGDGVNIASRLEGVAEPGGVCLSNAAYEQVRDKLRYDFVDLGDKGRPLSARRCLGSVLALGRKRER